MTEQAEEPRSGRGATAIQLGAAVAACAPGVVVRVTSAHIGYGREAIVFGLAIVGAAFLLSWAAEAAQLDVAAGLAIAVLAFIAVLPEYAVDVVFAWKGGHGVAHYGRACAARGATDASACSLALANMTGSNRLLIGIGWSMVVGVAWWQWRRRGRRETAVVLERSHSVEISFLAVATLYSLTLPLRRSITLLDAALLIGLFVAYTVRIAGAPTEEPDLVGPAAWVGSLGRSRRRMVTALLFGAAAGVIILCAGRFAEALVGTGAELGISEFLLVQWLAPLASEAPELLVAGLYAWRMNTNAGLGTLVSAKVNQWTLLVGTLPVVFALASGSHHGLPIDATQREELLLTASQSVFAVAVLANLALSTREALALFGLFWAQFIIGAFVPAHAHGTERLIVSAGYITLAVFVLTRDRGRLRRLIKDGFATSYEQLKEPV